MSWSDETLKAYVDGELDDRQRAGLTLALTADVALRRRLSAMKQERRRAAAASAPVPVPDEPVPVPVPLRQAGPPRLRVVPPAPALVVDQDEVRAAPARQWWAASSWWPWGGMALALGVGVLMGVWVGPQLDRQGRAAGLGLHEGGDGRLVAGGVIGQALSSQLASEPVPGAPVAVPLSFVDKGGRYCRTFRTAVSAGLACRQAGQTGQAAQWVVQTLAAVEAGPEGAARPAAMALPPAVLGAVDQRIAGDALDPARERQARDQGWGR